MNTQMTYDSTEAGFGLLSGRGSLAQRVRAWREQRRRVSRITFELNCYSDRELADLGLSRGDIPEVARGTFRRA